MMKFFLSLFALLPALNLLGAGVTIDAAKTDENPTLVFNNLDYIYGLGLTAAAEDMAGLLKRASGADLKITKGISASVVAGNRILLGSVAIEQYQLQEEAAKLSHGGAIIRTVGNDLLIFGNNAKGTSNGIYSFLSQEMGMRFFRMGEEYSHIPFKKVWHFEDIDRVAEPDCELRTVGAHPSDTSREAVLWLRRNRLAVRAYEGSEPFSNFGHALISIYPVRLFGKTHPEYYPMYSGSRYIPNEGEDWWQPCFTGVDPAVAVENIKAYFADPERQGVNSRDFAMNDSVDLCECPACIKQRKILKNTSEYYWFFLNKVGSLTRKAMKDRKVYLGVLAYFQTREVPAFALDQAFFVAYCADIGQYFDPQFRKFDRDLIDGWFKKGLPVAIYIYLAGDHLAPSYYPHLLAEEMKQLKKAGAVGFHDDGFMNLAWSAPMYYLYARLCNQIDEDPDAVLDEYFSHLYGTAAPQVRKLFDHFEVIHMRPRRGGFLRDYESLWELEPWQWNDYGVINELLQAAQDVVALDSSAGRNVKQLVEELEPSLMMLRMITLAKAASENSSKLTPAERLAALNCAADFPDIMRQAYELHEKMAAEKPFIRKMLGNRMEIDWRLSREFAIFLAKQEENVAMLGEEEKAALEKAITAYRGNPFRNIALKYAEGKLTLGPNLIEDPSFEKWPRNGISPTWRKWLKTPGKSVIGASYVAAHTGRQGLCFKNVIDGATVYCEVRGLKPGDRYLLKVFYRSRGDSVLGPNACVRLNWQQDGKWRWELPSYQFYPVRSDEKFQEMWTPIIVPDGADMMTINLSAAQLFNGEAACFDDLEFRKIESHE